MTGQRSKNPITQAQFLNVIFISSFSNLVNLENTSFMMENECHKTFPSFSDDSSILFEMRNTTGIECKTLMCLLFYSLNTKLQTYYYFYSLITYIEIQKLT